MVGDLINFRGLVYAPLNENGVIFLFGKIVDDLNMYIEEIKPGFPDCVARRSVGKGWERVSIEFEYLSSNFKAHHHDPEQCDILVCWEHDWQDCPIEVIELKTKIQTLHNYPIPRPNPSSGQKQDKKKDIQKTFPAVRNNTDVERWYHAILEGLLKVDISIKEKVNLTCNTWYSPEKVFAYLDLRKNAINIACFSRGESIEGTVLTRYQCWPRFFIRNEKDVEIAIKILTMSYHYRKDAIEAGEKSYRRQGKKPAPAVSEDINKK